MSRTFVGRGALQATAVIGALGACAGVASAAAGRQAPAHRIAVTPSSGSPATRFRLAFRAPDRAGDVNGMRRYYVVSAQGPAGRGNCAAQTSKYVDHVRAGARVRVTLAPGPNGWCLGRLHGTVTEQEQPICPFRDVCPAYAVLLKTIGHLSFRVDP